MCGCACFPQQLSKFLEKSKSIAPALRVINRTSTIDEGAGTQSGAALRSPNRVGFRAIRFSNSPIFRRTRVGFGVSWVTKCGSLPQFAYPDEVLECY